MKPHSESRAPSPYQVFPTVVHLQQLYNNRSNKAFLRHADEAACLSTQICFPGIHPGHCHKRVIYQWCRSYLFISRSRTRIISLLLLVSRGRPYLGCASCPTNRRPGLADNRFQGRSTQSVLPQVSPSHSQYTRERSIASLLISIAAPMKHTHFL